MSTSPDAAAAAAAQMMTLLSALHDLYISRLFSASSVTLAVYDWILTFSDEFETIYQSRWTIPKGLFYYIRVVTPPGIILGAFQLSNMRGPLSDNFCRIWAPLQTFGMLSSLVASNMLLTLRLIALYRRKPAMVWFIRGFFVVSYAVTLGLMIQAMVTFFDNIYYEPTVGVCATKQSSKTFPAIFYAPAAFETFVFALTAYRGWLDNKIITGAGSAPFLITLYRDGIISFFVMVAVRVWNIIIYLTLPMSSYNEGTLFMWAINTVLTTRVYMNLVWLAKNPKEPTSMASHNPVNNGGIRMRITTFTEVRSDHPGPFSPYKSHTPDTVPGSVDDEVYGGANRGAV